MTNEEESDARAADYRALLFSDTYSEYLMKRTLEGIDESAPRYTKHAFAVFHRLGDDVRVLRLVYPTDHEGQVKTASTAEEVIRRMVWHDSMDNVTWKKG